MAFTWEVEALRKIVEGIIADTASEYNKEAEEWGALRKPEWADVQESDDSFVGEEKEQGIRKKLKLKADDPLPDRYRVDKSGNVFDTYVEQSREAQKRAEDLDVWHDLQEQMYEFHPHNIDPDMWGYRQHIPTEEWYDEKAYRISEKDKKENLRKRRQMRNWLKELEPENVVELTDPFGGSPVKVWRPEQRPEVLRLPHLKDEEKPDLSPFLSYLLRQSPYARLPAAGLLGLGLMGYSKPAY